MSSHLCLTSTFLPGGDADAVYQHHFRLDSPEDLKNQKLKLGREIFSLTLSANFRKKWICSIRPTWK